MITHVGWAGNDMARARGRSERDPEAVKKTLVGKIRSSYNIELGEIAGTARETARKDWQHQSGKGRLRRRGEFGSGALHLWRRRRLLLRNGGFLRQPTFSSPSDTVLECSRKRRSRRHDSARFDSTLSIYGSCESREQVHADWTAPRGAGEYLTGQLLTGLAFRASGAKAAFPCDAHLTIDR
eukprot:5047104-Pleurochrysis_carterae.AAC.3